MKRTIDYRPLAGPRMHSDTALAGTAASGPGADAGGGTTSASEAKGGAAWIPQARLDLSTK